MSSVKHKREQDEIPGWKCCINCGWKVCSLPRHEEKCTASARVQLEEIVWTEHHGVIYNDTFIANVISTDFGESTVMKDADKKGISRDSVVIHPATIRALGGRPAYKQAVLIQNTFIGYTCPSDEVAVGDVRLSSQYVTMMEMTKSRKSVITVRLISSSSVEDAAEVLISSTKRLEYTIDSADLRHTLVDRVLTVGTWVPITNSNLSNYLQVNKIVGTSGHTCTLDSVDTKQSQFSFIEMSTKERGLTNSRQFFRVTRSTKLRWFNARNESRLNDIINMCAGYEKFRTRLNVIISAALTGGTDGFCGRGVLIHGPTGSGKRFITEAVCRKVSGVQWMELDCADIQDAYLNGGGQSAVVAMFQSAITKAQLLSPKLCIVFIHHVDIVCLRRERLNSAHRNLSIAVIVAIDTILAEGGHVLVIATTYDRSDIDSELLSGNRLSVDIELTSPTADDRLEILSRYLSQMSPDMSDVDIRAIAEKAHGLWAWHLADLCLNAYIKAYRSENHSLMNQSDVLDSMQKMIPAGMDTVVADDLNLSDIRPRVNLKRIVLLNGLSQTRKKLATISVAPVKWSDIGGREQLKQSLRQAIEDPISHTAQYSMFNMDRVKGILLYGPPGCSKTMIAKAIATQCGVNFFAVQGSELLSCYHGESERNIRNVFIKARRAAPAIVFFDEIDAIGGSRGRSGSSNVTGSMMQSLLVEMDGVDTLSNVTIIAATNRPQTMDKALLRPGRLDRKIYVRLPDVETRHEIFNIEFRVTPTHSDVHLDDLVEKTEGYSCAEVVHLCNEARMAAFREFKESVTSIYARHFNTAFSKVTPRTDQSTLDIYEQFERGSSK